MCDRYTVKKKFELKQFELNFGLHGGSTKVVVYMILLTILGFLHLKRKFSVILLIQGVAIKFKEFSHYYSIAGNPASFVNI